jgi:acetamidase/formamidase
VLHYLNAERVTLHGHFSPDLPPVLTIDSGDSVQLQCLDAGWGLEAMDGIGHERRRIEPREPLLDDGHCLTGPISVRGAEPGMTLAVHIETIEVGQWGFTFAGGWPSAWNDGLGVSATGVMHKWTFDHKAMTAQNQHGHIVRLRPFMGIYGVAPALPGVHSTVPPRPTGGNIDCKELIAGSTLYLPVEVPGALFSVGDGHAAQGDGEICVTAIECPMDRVDLRFELVEDMPLTFPIARTPHGWVAMGFHEDLNEALVIALESMLSLMKRLHGLERLDALALASVTVDFRVTQVVNEVRGVHAILPHDAIQHASTDGQKV